MFRERKEMKRERRKGEEKEAKEEERGKRKRKKTKEEEEVRHILSFSSKSEFDIGSVSKILKHEAFMFGASKTKHDDLGSELLITTAPIPDPSEKLMVLDGKSKRTYLKAVVLIRSFSMLPWSSIPDCVLPVKLAIGTAVHFGMSHIPLEGTTMVWRSAENQAV
ncbi:hypothetical protein POTOM_008657 [Populus tomentosa]|uniref:Uncharacterized protein n=1 Tax=Populus tomentosa TaxID=118781 RepID=A0A8X8DC50_POPTO|nr:hypothetical protein POTOM_008657 [Populus tomentosa]